MRHFEMGLTVFSQRAHRVVREEDDDEKEGENGTRKTGTITTVA